MDKKIHRCVILLLFVGALAFSSGAEDSTTDQAGTTAAPQTGKYKEAPMLAELVRQGLLPAVAERLPQDPLVVQPVEEIGTIRRRLASRDAQPDELMDKPPNRL